MLALEGGTEKQVNGPRRRASCTLGAGGDQGEGGHRCGYLVEFSGDKFSTSVVDSFHNYNLEDKKQNRIAKWEIKERSGINYSDIIIRIVQPLSFGNGKLGNVFLESRLRGLY